MFRKSLGLEVGLMGNELTFTLQGILSVIFQDTGQFLYKWQEARRVSSGRAEINCSNFTVCLWPHNFQGVEFYPDWR